MAQTVQIKANSRQAVHQHLTANGLENAGGDVVVSKPLQCRLKIECLYSQQHDKRWPPFLNSQHNRLSWNPATPRVLSLPPL